MFTSNQLVIRISLAHPQSDKSMKMPHVGSAAEPSVIDDFHSYKPPFVDDVPICSHMFPYVPICSHIFLCFSQIELSNNHHLWPTSAFFRRHLQRRSNWTPSPSWRKASAARETTPPGRLLDSGDTRDLWISKRFQRYVVLGKQGKIF